MGEEVLREPALATEMAAPMIEQHWDGIAAYCRPENKVSLGFVEGLNNNKSVCCSVVPMDCATKNTFD